MKPIFTLFSILCFLPTLLSAQMMDSSTEFEGMETGSSYTGAPRKSSTAPIISESTNTTQQNDHILPPHSLDLDNIEAPEISAPINIKQN